MNIEATANSVAEKIRPQANDIEKARRLPAHIAKIIADAGLFRMLIPRDINGMECHPAEALRAMEILGNADASAGWCLMIAATTGVTSAYMEKSAALNVFGSADTIAGGVFAPMGKAVQNSSGSYQLSGHWQWASGSANCHWLLGGAIVMDGNKPRMNQYGTPDARQFLFPADQITLPDTWHVNGLCGTGSGDMVADNIEIPAAHSVSITYDKPVAEGPLYAFPVFGLLALGIAAVSLGNARAAIDELKLLAAAKRSQGSSKTLSQRSTAQQQLALAEADLLSARAFMFDEVNKAYVAAQTNGAISMQDRANIRLAATNAVRRSADVTRSMYDLAGGSAVFLSSTLQRRMRDAHAATQHMMVAPQTYELIGRVGFGLETDATFL